MGPYFIDLEAFQHGHKTIIKELCILDIDRPLRPLYFLFTPPQAWQTLSTAEQDSYDYQERHLHQLSWGEGESRYCRKCVYHHIKENFPACENAIFYVMGHEKCKVLAKMFPKLNFIEYNITFNTLPPTPHNIFCHYRNHGEHCASLKCFRLYDHYISSCHS